MRAKDTLFEFYEEQGEADFGYVSSADDDKIGPEKKTNTRTRPRLTLKHINKLRKLKQLKRQEKIKHLGLVSRMYGNKPEE